MYERIGETPQDGETRIDIVPQGPYDTVRHLRFTSSTRFEVGGWQIVSEVDFVDREPARTAKEPDISSVGITT